MTEDRFHLWLRYTHLLGSAGAEAQYDGQVASMTWSTRGDSLAHIYGYEYDALGRLVEADYNTMGEGTDQSGRFTVDTLRYDLNGNLTHIRRSGAPGVIDDLTYAYRRGDAGNQLRAVRDTAAHADSAGYPEATPQIDPAEPAPLDTVFAYGPNGNRIADSTRGQYATYNYFNVPDEVEIEGNGTITWRYAAGGEKLSKTAKPEEGGRTTTHYVGGFVYESATVQASETDTTLRYTSFSEGRILAEADSSAERGYAALTYEYHLTDHLGNTRVAFEPSGDSLRLTQQRAYYPHGMRWARQRTIAGATSRNEHLYNGKELVDELGLNWYHYGARYYDVALARWLEMDPADEFHTPYTYVGGDPVNLTDPDGRQAEEARELSDVEYPPSNKSTLIPYENGQIITDKKLANCKLMCNEFVYAAYRKAGYGLPASIPAQGEWFKENGTLTTDFSAGRRSDVIYTAANADLERPRHAMIILEKKQVQGQTAYKVISADNPTDDVQVSKWITKSAASDWSGTFQFIGRRPKFKATLEEAVIEATDQSSGVKPLPPVEIDN